MTTENRASEHWTKKQLQELHERIDWLAEVAEIERRAEAGLMERPNEPPYSIGRIGSYAHDDPLRHEMCRNILQSVHGGPLMWIHYVTDDGMSLTYWFEDNHLYLGAFPSKNLIEARVERSLESVPQMYIPRKDGAIFYNWKTCTYVEDGDDWTRMLREGHWKMRRSAQELARIWCTNTGFRVPEEMTSLLASSDRTIDMAFLHGYPEHVTKLPVARAVHSHDLMLLGVTDREKAVVCIEAKVDESFGTDTIAAHVRKHSNGRSKVPRRVNNLVELLFGPRASADQKDIAPLRYQLLAAFAATAIEARNQFAPLAVFVVHEFRTEKTSSAKVERNSRDLTAFVKKVAGVDDFEAGRLYGPVTLSFNSRDEPSVDLIVGKVVTDVSAESLWH